MKDFRGEWWHIGREKDDAGKPLVRIGGRVNGAIIGTVDEVREMLARYDDSKAGEKAPRLIMLTME